jgi:hypothetical protein
VSRGTFPARGGYLAPAHHQGGGTMHIDRALADRYLAFLGFALSFLFLLAVVAFSFTVNSNLNDAPHIAQTISK